MGGREDCRGTHYDGRVDDSEKRTLIQNKRQSFRKFSAVCRLFRVAPIQKTVNVVDLLISCGCLQAESKITLQ